MILELKYARGMTIWIDGQLPEPGWHFGDAPGDGAFDLHGKAGDWIEVAGHKLQRLQSDVSFDSVSPSHTPTTIKLTFSDGSSRDLTVTKCVWGDPDDEDVQVTLVNGKVIGIDEITLFVRAEG